jgi:membrane protein DedA with SNARE-associated domain
MVAFVGMQFLGALPWSTMLLSNGWAGEGVRWIEANGIRPTKE